MNQLPLRLVLGLAFLAACGVSSAADKQRQLWVTNSSGNDVHVFDVATLELVRRIEVGPNPHGISATADGRTVHIALEHFRKDEGELLWIDAATGKTTDRLKVGPRPNEQFTAGHTATLTRSPGGTVEGRPRRSSIRP